ncbi:MAG TPA: GNAT family N-acetyltransferase [Chitinophagaceae bacterium]
MIERAEITDHPVLVTIWEASVRASHHFLPEDYLQKIKTLLPEIFPGVNVFVHRNDDGLITGFLGVSDDKIEMLFIDPQHMRKGIGMQLTRFAIDELKMRAVDVNEQNDEALRFYQHMGFVVTKRNDVDGLGKPFPILEMQLKQ